MKKKNKRMSVPCPYMIYDPQGYHTCALQGTNVLCAWHYNVLGESYTVSFTTDERTGEITIISDFNFPERIEERRRNAMTKEDVSKLCPRGFTYEQIDSKIKALELQHKGRVEFEGS